MPQGEFELIGKYFSRLGVERADVRIGVGDDGAVPGRLSRAWDLIAPLAIVTSLRDGVSR